MALPAQNFQNHKRYLPLFHFTAVPLLALYLLYSLYVLVRAQSLASLMGVVLAAGVTASVFAARTMASTVQDRVIRLEMSMRFARVLGAAQAADAIAKLTLRQIIALRFASDAELPALVGRVASKELTTGSEVKQAIREWQADYLRA
jgi:Family of unknown function (DUF6526)